ncbi:hypothetical protein [Methylocella silvestris]|nr:hypothetical protein [Methylocella silvestris]
MAPETLNACYDKEPFGFEHSLHKLEMMTFDSLQTLSEKYIGHNGDYYVCSSAKTPDTAFNSVPVAAYAPHQAMQKVGSERLRVLMKRPENYAPEFRDLLEHLIKQICEGAEGLKRKDVIRIEGGLLISSSAATTPFHFDPETNFFSQIEGEKIYHVYSPSVLSERELERFFHIGRLSIAQVDLKGRDPAREHVFRLNAGLGLHQPLNAPHWVETRDSRSISFAMVYETEATRVRAQTRAANYYLRLLALNPTRPGVNPAADALKTKAMNFMLPIRGKIGDATRAIRSLARA